jgi:hypothetical protein
MYMDAEVDVTGGDWRNSVARVGLHDSHARAPAVWGVLPPGQRRLVAVRPRWQFRSAERHFYGGRPRLSEADFCFQTGTKGVGHPIEMCPHLCPLEPYVTIRLASLMAC